MNKNDVKDTKTIDGKLEDSDLTNQDQPPKTKKGFLKTVTDFVVTTYTKVKTNPVGRICLKLGKAATAVLVVKEAYNKGYKKGQENPVVVTITPIEKNPEETSVEEPEQTAEADIPVEEESKEEE